MALLEYVKYFGLEPIAPVFTSATSSIFPGAIMCSFIIKSCLPSVRERRGHSHSPLAQIVVEQRVIHFSVISID